MAHQVLSISLIFLFSLSSIFLSGTLLSLYPIESAFDEHEVLHGKQYSYLWEDYPLKVPITLKPSAEVTIVESVHYPVVDPEAHLEWMYDSPHGEGTFRLGPNHRYATISMFHQLHCLRTFRAAIADGTKYPMKYQRKHLNHCLNYLRESALCAADTTLEPGDFTTRDFDLHRTGAKHMCRDPQELYDLTENDWVEWYIYMSQHNISLSALREQERKELGLQFPIE